MPMLFQGPATDMVQSTIDGQVDSNNWGSGGVKSPLLLQILCCGMFLCLIIGCQRSSRDESELIQMRMNSQVLNSEPLRQGLRNLAQTTQLNKKDMADETRVLINAWLKDAANQSIDYQPSKLLDIFDSRELDAVGCPSPELNQLSAADIELLYQARLMKQLSDWIVAEPVKDQLFQPMLTAKMSELNPDQAVQLEQAYKLFDWTIRNIKLTPTESSQSNKRTRDPRLPVQDGGVGYGYLPWESALFGAGDFVVRGRVFAALAAQQGMDTCWISVGAAPGAAGDLFMMGLLINEQLLLLEPKLGIPILDPDTDQWATLQDAAKNERVLRRLNSPQHEYAIQQTSVSSVQLLIDATPFALSRRARLLENSMLGDERMSIAIDIDAMANRLSKAAPNAIASLWNLPLIAQIYKKEVEERLEEITPFTMRYMAEHLVWLSEFSIGIGRNLHLTGKFENTLDGQGALRTYFDTRVDDASLRRMAYNPDIQRSLGLVRGINESSEQYEARLAQANAIFSRAKFDAAYLLAQLHFDRGDFKSSSYWLSQRLLGDPRAERWEAHGWYLLARALIEMGKYAEAEDALTKPSLDQAGQPAFVVNPQDAGNRIRLRYLRRLMESTQKTEIQTTQSPESPDSENK